MYNLVHNSYGGLPIFVFKAFDYIIQLFIENSIIRQLIRVITSMCITYVVFKVISTLKIKRFSKKMVSALIIYLEHRNAIWWFLNLFSIFDILRLWVFLEKTYSFISMCLYTIAEYNKYKAHSLLKIGCMYMCLSTFFISALFYLLRARENKHITKSYYFTSSQNFKRVFDVEKDIVKYLGVILPVGISYIYSLSQIAFSTNEITPVLVDKTTSISGIINSIDIAWMSMLVLSNSDCYQLIYPFLAYFSVYLENFKGASFTLLDFSYNISFAVNISCYILPKFIYPYIFEPKYYYFGVEPYRISFLRLRQNFKKCFKIVFTKYSYLRNTVIIWASYRMIFSCIKYLGNGILNINIIGTYDILRAILLLIIDVQFVAEYLISTLLTILSTFLYTIFPFSYYYIKN